MSPKSKGTLLVVGMIAGFILSSCDTSQPFTATSKFPKHKPSKSRFLHQRGYQLYDSSGKARILRTMNVGGWLHWEAWMFGCELNVTKLHLGSESQLLSRFEKYYGKEAAHKFQLAIYERFITDKDLSDIAKRGFDSIRLPLNHVMFDDEDGWRRLAKVVKRVGRHKLGVFLDMHAAPGGQSNIFTADPDKVLLWDDVKAQERLIEIWERLAKEYKTNPTIWGYDLLNEPAPPKPKQLIDLYERIISAIRKHDKEHLIILEGTGLSRNFNCFTKRLDNNVAYSPHVYLWVGKPDKQWIKSMQRLSKQHDTPVWVGEFGEDLPHDLKYLRQNFEKMSGWAIWSWKRVKQGLVGSVNMFDAPPEWWRLIKSLHPAAKEKPVMSKKQAFKALDAFLQSARRYKPHPGMKDALGR